MKKGIILTILVIFLVFVSAETANASLGSLFGGRIILKPEVKIFSLESAGFNCQMLGGTSISIIPIGSPVGTPSSYYIPAAVSSVTRTITTPGQLILGIYAGKIPIQCVYPSAPPVVVTVPLSIINYFGTSIK